MATVPTAFDDLVAAANFISAAALKLELAKDPNVIKAGQQLNLAVVKIKNASSKLANEQLGYDGRVL